MHEHEGLSGEWHLLKANDVSIPESIPLIPQLLGRPTHQLPPFRRPTQPLIHTEEIEHAGDFQHRHCGPDLGLQLRQQRRVAAVGERFIVGLDVDEARADGARGHFAPVGERHDGEGLRPGLPWERGVVDGLQVGLGLFVG